MAPPQSKVTLLCFKDGAMVEEVPASVLPCHVLGRSSDMADITMAHESISRQHAIIAQDADGNVFVRPPHARVRRLWAVVLRFPPPPPRS